VNLRQIDLQADVAKATDAKVLMVNIRPYFEKLRSDCIDSFIGCPVDDTANMMIIKMKLDLIDSLELDLEKVIFAGKIANVELEDIFNG
jgi:hypothetical protein